MKRTQVQIFKLSLEKIMTSDRVINDYSMQEAILSGEVVSLANNQVVDQIQSLIQTKGLQGLKIYEAIINLVVPSASGPKAKTVANQYRTIAQNGFDLNGRHYVRLCAGSGQLRRNTITFVLEELHDSLFEALCCGLSAEDFGEDFNTAKFNAYYGLSMSGMQFLKEPPRVCVVDDYEQIKPHLPVDYIQTVRQESRKNGRKTTVVDKTIDRYFYDDLDLDLAPLNSFDGQGLADPDYMARIARELGYLKPDGSGYIPSQVILRAPWVKGLVANFDFKEYCRQHGVTILRDIYGSEYDVENIDLLISRSQFKMAKLYGRHGGWQYHVDSMERFGLKWGVVIANRAHDDEYRPLNYQYIQALELSDSDIVDLCKPTEEFLTRLCSGNLEAVTRTLIGGYTDVDEDAEYNGDFSEPTCDEDKPYHSLWQRVVRHNPALLGDKYIRDQIFQEVAAKFQRAKVGKLLCRGNYAFIVSDPVAQIQSIIRTHALDGERDMEVRGLIDAGSVYSQFWNSLQTPPTKIALMRSPLIDESEVTVCGLARSVEMDQWYSHMSSGLIFSVHDLTTLALQNCDFDGDRVYSTNSVTVINGAQKNPAPILYPAASTQLVGAITLENMVEADVRGLNSKVGSLSNLGTSFYALRAKYPKESPEYKELSKRIKILGELVGVEIDKIKTGIPPEKPTSWRREHIPTSQVPINGRDQNIIDCSIGDKEHIERHNALVPDVKPEFMRYIYPKLDNDILKYRKAFGSECRYNYGVSLDELLRRPVEELTEAQAETLYRYKKDFPVIASNCTMNVICRRFEKLEANLKRQKNARNMLPEFATGEPLDSEMLKALGNIVDLFVRQKNFIIRENNSYGSLNNNNKSLALNTRERLDTLRQYIQEQVLYLFGGDVQGAYNHLIDYMRSHQNTRQESVVWDIMGPLMLVVIPKAGGKEVAA